MKKTWGQIKAEAQRKNKRFIVVQLQADTWSVEDCQQNRTKAVFYDEAAKELAEHFCANINNAVRRK